MTWKYFILDPTDNGLWFVDGKILGETQVATWRSYPTSTTGGWKKVVDTETTIMLEWIGSQPRLAIAVLRP